MADTANGWSFCYCINFTSIVAFCSLDSNNRIEFKEDCTESESKQKKSFDIFNTSSL